MSSGNCKHINYFTMIFICALLLTNTVYPQEKNELSRIDKIISEAGKIIRYDDYKLPDIKGSYGEGKLEVKVRVVNTGSTPYSYFVLISRKTKYDTKRASISEEELTDVIEAFDSLVKMSITESTTSSYANIKYVSEEGFQMGYYVDEKRNSHWFVTLEKYGTGNTFFLKKPEELKEVLLAAQKKIKDLQ